MPHLTKPGRHTQVQYLEFTHLGQTQRQQAGITHPSHLANSYPIKIFQRDDHGLKRLTLCLLCLVAYCKGLPFGKGVIGSRCKDGHLAQAGIVIDKRQIDGRHQRPIGIHLKDLRADLLTIGERMPK